MFPSTITRHNLSSLITSIKDVEASLQRTDLATTKKIEQLETFSHQILGFEHSLRALREISMLSHESKDPQFREVEKLMLKVTRQWDTKYEHCRNSQLHEIKHTISQAIENKKPNQLQGLALKLKSPLFNRLLKRQQKAQVQDLLQLISKNENELRRDQLINQLLEQETPLDEKPLGEKLSWGDPFDNISYAMPNILGYLSRADLSICRVLSKNWQKASNELFWGNIYIQLQDLANNPPYFFPWNLKAIVQQINSANYSAFKKVSLLDQEIKRKIGPGALLGSKLITTDQHIEQIIQHCDQEQSSNLHRVWKAFQKHNKCPDLKTKKEISDYLNNPTNQKALNHTRFLALTDLELTDLPKEIKNFENLEKLDLSRNWLTDLSEGFGELQKLKTLNLSGNQLTDLPKGLKELQYLERLDLRENQLTDLPEGFGELRHLKWLDLSGNWLTDLSGRLAELQNLKTLNLSGNQLTDLPKGLKELQNLEELDLSGNWLTDLPEGFGELQNLKYLNLRGNQLTDLSGRLAELQNLKKLNLSGNRLADLSGRLAELQNLEELDLGENQLTDLPEGLAELQNLKELDLRGNQLTHLPEGFEELQKLKYLNLYRNRFTDLPEGLKELQYLERLDLRENQLTDLPEWLKELKNLKYLNLHGNRLTDFPKWLKELKNLQWLDLDKNQLTDFPEWLSEWLKELENLRWPDLKRDP